MPMYAVIMEPLFQPVSTTLKGIFDTLPLNPSKKTILDTLVKREAIYFLTSKDDANSVANLHYYDGPHYHKTNC